VVEVFVVGGNGGMCLYYVCKYFLWNSSMGPFPG